MYVEEVCHGAMPVALSRSSIAGMELKYRMHRQSRGRVSDVWASVLYCQL